MVTSSGLYYIQNIGFCGNCLKFWRVDGRGYTLNLDEAWKVPFEQAISICRSRPKEDLMWSTETIDAASQRHVSIEVLKMILAKDEEKSNAST